MYQNPVSSSLQAGHMMMLGTSGLPTQGHGKYSSLTFGSCGSLGIQAHGGAFAGFAVVLMVTLQLILVMMIRR